MNIAKIIQRHLGLCGVITDELTDDICDNNGLNRNVINSKSFKYKTVIIGSTYNVSEQITNADGNRIDNPAYDANKSGTKQTEIVVPLKHLGNFWNSLNIPLINREVSLALSWSANCVITDIKRRIVAAAVRDNSVINANFKITDTKLCFPEVTLSAENDNKLLEQLKTGLKRTIKWNKYKSEMSN